MDKQFQIISDSSCDLPPELAREKNIRVVPFYVSFDDKTYLKEVEEVGVRSTREWWIIREYIRNPHFREFRIIMMPLSLM